MASVDVNKKSEKMTYVNSEYLQARFRVKKVIEYGNTLKK